MFYFKSDVCLVAACCDDRLLFTRLFFFLSTTFHSLLSVPVGTFPALVWGQCSDVLQGKIKQLEKYGAQSAKKDGLWLLKEVKAVVYNFQSQEHYVVSLWKAVDAFRKFRQHRSMTVPQYLEKFKNLVESGEYCGGSIGNDTNIMRNVLAVERITNTMATAEQMERVMMNAKDRYLGVAFILQADPTRYGRLIWISPTNTCRGPIATRRRGWQRATYYQVARRSRRTTSRWSG